MGTNYYWTDATPDCPTCGHHRAEEIHIGKSSYGWEFSFHGTDEIRSWKDWLAILKGGGEIVDEYGAPITFEDFRKVVEERSHPNGLLNHTDYCREMYPDYAKSLWKDGEGYSFSDGEFS